MSNKELLALAAKAAGYKFETRGCIDEWFWVLTDNNDWHPWNPLTSDSDALRLAVKLQIDVNFIDVKKRVWAEPQYINEPPYPIHEGYGSDPYAATRRAIVRAAAEIGRGME
jgi:hypothetical protein